MSGHNMYSKLVPYGQLNYLNRFTGYYLTLSNLSISTQNNYGQPDPMDKRNCDITLNLHLQEQEHFIVILYKFTATSVEGQRFPGYEAGFDKLCLKGKITARFAGPGLNGIGTLYLVFDSPQKSQLFGHDYTQTCIWFKNQEDYESLLFHFQKYWTHDIIIHPKIEENPKTESNPNLFPNITEESKIPESDIVCKRLNQKKPQSGAGGMRMPNTMDSKFIPELNEIQFFLDINLTLNVSISTLNSYGKLDPMVKRNCDISFGLDDRRPYIVIIYKDYTVTSAEAQCFARYEAGSDQFCLNGKITASFAGPGLDGIGTLYLVFDNPQKSRLFGHDYTQTCIWFKNKKDYELVLEHFQKYWTHDIIIHPNFEENPKIDSNPNLSPNIIQESKIAESDIVWKCLDQKKPQSGTGVMRMTKTISGIKKSLCCGLSLSTSKELLDRKE